MNYRIECKNNMKQNNCCDTSVRPSVCLSHVGITSKRRHQSSDFFHHLVDLRTVNLLQNSDGVAFNGTVKYRQWLKWFCEAGGAHLTKPGWSKPHTHSNPTNLALFRHKITLYRFNQGAHTIAGGSNGSRGAEPP